MACLMTHAYQFIGAHQWTVPIFLFRYHAEVEAYIFDLARDPARVRDVSGRHGNDFIAPGTDPASGEVVRFLAGEEKWRASLNKITMSATMLCVRRGTAGGGGRGGEG